MLTLIDDFILHAIKPHAALYMNKLLVPTVHCATAKQYFLTLNYQLIMSDS